MTTNAISEYLPDEESGKPSNLSTLLQELKRRASGNEEELSLSPGISQKQPLRAVMLSWSQKEDISGFPCLALSEMLMIMGTAVLQKYVNSLGGIGTSGVASSSSYITKMSNKEVLPEKHEKALHSLANALLEYETLSAEDMKHILLPCREETQLMEQQEQEGEGDLILA